MAKGSSGRIVVEIQPALKRELHSVLALDGQTLKSWFIEVANLYISNRSSVNKVATNNSKKVVVKSNAQ